MYNQGEHNWMGWSVANFKFHISIGKVGCHREDVIEVADEDLEGLNESQRATILDSLLYQWLHNHCNLYWEEAE
jgi:hypothetical protein